MTTTKSRVQASLDLYERAEELIPGKTQLISRRASSFAHPISPIYADHAKGSRFVDVDGNEYIDWVNAVTAIILGHADDVVDGAVREQIDKGSLFTLNSPLEIELAELLIDTIPSAEMVRYTKGGGESCAVAVRIARGTTGKDKILFSGYHGWHGLVPVRQLPRRPRVGRVSVRGHRADGRAEGACRHGNSLHLRGHRQPAAALRGEQGRGRGGDDGADALGASEGRVPRSGQGTLPRQRGAP